MPKIHVDDYMKSRIDRLNSLKDGDISPEELARHISSAEDLVLRLKGFRLPTEAQKKAIAMRKEKKDIVSADKDEEIED